MQYTRNDRSPNHIDLILPKLGYVKLYRFCDIEGFSKNYPSGRPWHIVTSGIFVATPEEAIAILEKVVADWDKPETNANSGITYTGYGANSHAPCWN